MNCSHYERNCYIISPCCGKNFGCRKCHDEFYEFKENEHKINRFEIKKIICKKCEIEQPVSNECINCKLEFGKYFCKICNFFDNDISKGYYHCEKCGICRVGGKENFFHCDICNLCLNINTKDTHKCIDGSEQNCPLCFDNLFESTKPFTKLKCGHIIHCDSPSIEINNISLSNITLNNHLSSDNISTRVKARNEKARKKTVHKKSQHFKARNLGNTSSPESLSYEY